MLKTGGPASAPGVAAVPGVPAAAAGPCGGGVAATGLPDALSVAALKAAAARGCGAVENPKLPEPLAVDDVEANCCCLCCGCWRAPARLRRDVVSMELVAVVEARLIPVAEPSENGDVEENENTECGWASAVEVDARLVVAGARPEVDKAAAPDVAVEARMA